RRALEAYRIPILEQRGFEADDVIGTLARKAAAESYEVLIVSSDKDMLQLVNDKIRVLNPPKDNLISDAAKVEELLGVRPGQVIDVMALRGDSIDNIPGAPGVGDKGSVEIIKRFGTLENALDHAAEIERKTYRESLQSNRETILWSKQMVTIDQDVAIDLHLEKMVAGEPDTDALRKLFSELEFMTLLKELAPAMEIKETDYRELKLKDLENLRSAQVRLNAPLAVSFAFAKDVVDAEPEEQDDTAAQSAQLLFDPQRPSPSREPASGPLQLALAVEAGKSFTASLNNDEISNNIKLLLGDAGVPKAVHNYKAVLREVASRGIKLAGVRDEPMLYSYLINPTYTKHSLAELAIRSFNLSLSDSLAEAADVGGRLAGVLRREVEEGGLMPVYLQIDLPLVPVLARMEDAGVKIDTGLLRNLSARLEKECDAKAREIHEKAGSEFNINSPKQLGDVLFNKLNLPKPVKYGKGKMISTAVDVLEELSAEHEVPRLV